jgi:hypothetical protein
LENLEVKNIWETRLLLEDNITQDLKEIGWEVVDKGAVVNMAVDL